MLSLFLVFPMGLREALCLVPVSKARWVLLQQQMVKAPGWQG